MADVPFSVIIVSFRTAAAALSAGSVSFPFIHTKDMPVSFAFSGFPFADKCFKRRTQI
ncbi:MAG: hypothetical protein K2X57_30945 [Xanthobacteraceae bacterium]|nr:hypothetical protein [Xanthobacteraceae bacterium]